MWRRIGAKLFVLLLISIFPVRILQINLQMSFIQIKVLTLKGVLYGDMFRYAKDPILRRVYDERMKNDFDNFPEVALLLIYSCL